MRALNNPWVVGALAATAIGMVGYQILQASGKRPGPLPAALPARAVTPAPKPSGTSPTAGSTIPEEAKVAPQLTNVDANYFEAHITKWTESPQRDPFHLLTVKPIQKSAVLSPVPTWKLKAIWQQAGKPLVVIDRKVYREGDLIEGYRIVSIDDAQVWFQGPEGLESLGFGKRAPRVAGTQSTQSAQH